MAELLLQNGADVNCLEFRNHTPLHLAAQYGHVETAELLIKHGADVNFQGTVWKFEIFFIKSMLMNYNLDMNLKRKINGVRRAHTFPIKNFKFPHCA